MNRHSTSIGSAPSSPSQVGETHDATGARAAKTTLAVLINYNDLGSQATERGAYSEALADYTQAIKHSPQLPEPLYNRALTYGRLHRERDALQDALASVKIDPLFADGFALSARLSCSGEKRKRLVSYPQIRRLSLHIESASEETSSWSRGIAAQLNRTMHGQPRSPSKTHPQNATTTSLPGEISASQTSALDTHRWQSALSTARSPSNHPIRLPYTIELTHAA